MTIEPTRIFSPTTLPTFRLSPRIFRLMTQIGWAGPRWRAHGLLPLRRALCFPRLYEDSAEVPWYYRGSWLPLRPARCASKGQGFTRRPVGGSVEASEPLVGLSEVPSPHKMNRDGGDPPVAGLICSSMPCGGPLPGGPSRPICGAEIRVNLDHGAIRTLTPPHALVVAREVLHDSCGTGVVCSDSALFDSTDCIRKWRVTHPSAPPTVYTVQQYLSRR